MSRGIVFFMLAGFAAVCPLRAQDFAPAGDRATLSVQYRYESRGKQVGSGSAKYELHEWRSAYTVDMTAELAAARPLLQPSLQPPDAAATATIQRRDARAQRAAAQMAPMMADAEAIAARCKEDEKCIEREIAKMGLGSSGTPQVDSALAAGRDAAAAVRPGANRYQAWRAVSQKGRYAIDGGARIVHADPGCMSLPKGRCTRDMQSKGAGDVPAVPGGRGGPAAVEVDVQAQTLALMLPAPIGVLPYEEVVSSNEPKGTQEVPPGVYRRQLKFVTPPGGKVGGSAPFIVPLKGGWRSQAGEQVVQIRGEGPDGGTLTIRWAFEALAQK